MSRYRTNSAESSAPVPSANSISATTSGTSSSHDHRGRAPSSNSTTNTGIRFSTRLNDALNTTDSGTASRGNSILRTSGSRATSATRQPLVASLKNVNATTPSSIAAGKYGTWLSPTATVYTPYSTPNSNSG